MHRYLTVILKLTLCIVVLTVQSYGQIPIPNLENEVSFYKYPSITHYNSKKKKNTSLFQGNKETKRYFEGWYFKMVAADGESIISVIPGIALSPEGNEQHAFIQTINGKTAETSYHTYPIEAFAFSTTKFEVRIADNYFSEQQIILNIEDESSSISGSITMTNITPYTDKKGNKESIMGWYRKVPFMQCYHGVVSITHDLQGHLSINGSQHNFAGGKGYIEKDWGSSMPSSWIWIQSNHFENKGTSFMLSIADIPFVGRDFNGFLGFLYYKGKIYKFATYLKSDLDLKIIDENTVKIRIENKEETLEITAKRNQAGLLKAPVEGNMDRRIAESIDAEIEIKLFDINQNLIYRDNSTIAGFELVGEVQSLLDNIK